MNDAVHGVVHLLSAFHVDEAHASRRWNTDRPGHQNDLSTRIARCCRDRVTHLAAGSVGDETYWVDGLARWPGRDDDLAASPKTRGIGNSRAGQSTPNRCRQRFRLHHAAGAGFATSLRAFGGAVDDNAAAAQ